MPQVQAGGIISTHQLDTLSDEKIAKRCERHDPTRWSATSPYHNRGCRWRSVPRLRYRYRLCRHCLPISSWLQSSYLPSEKQLLSAVTTHCSVPMQKFNIAVRAAPTGP
jgi:hypothetical protein|eukprot:COSAG02_NODE_1068_length_14812_cov_15.091342_10_plen_109_part_00